MSHRFGYLRPTRQTFAPRLKRFRAFLPRLDFSFAAAASTDTLHRQRDADYDFCAKAYQSKQGLRNRSAIAQAVLPKDPKFLPVNRQPTNLVLSPKEQAHG
jgi:hypothetical protein